MSIELGTFFLSRFLEISVQKFKIFLRILSSKITTLFCNYYFILLENARLKISTKSSFISLFIYRNRSLHRLKTGGKCLNLGISKTLEVSSIKIICSSPALRAYPLICYNLIMNTTKTEGVLVRK